MCQVLIAHLMVLIILASHCVVMYVYVQSTLYCSTTSIGALVSKARLTESSSSGSDTDSTAQHLSQGMIHGRIGFLHPDGGCEYPVLPE